MTRENPLQKRTLADLFHNEVAAWIVLAVSLVITALGWFISTNYVERRAADRFAYEVEDARQRILSRMLEYEQVLRGGVSVFDMLGREATRAEWLTFTAGLQIQKHFPGIQGIGYAVMLSPDALSTHTLSVRAEGFDDYTVKPSGARDQYSAIVYLEPFDWRNQRAFGYDMYSNPMRRAAMDHARDTGAPAVSGRVVLVQETQEDVQAGFLVYLPVYRPGLPVETVEQRRAALTGFVYSPFRMADLMRGILGGDAPDVEFVLHDGTAQQVSDTLLYDSRSGASARAAAHSQTTRIALPGREWTAEFHSTPSFEAAMASMQPELIALGGLTVDFLLFSVIWSLSTERRRVHAKVASMTADVRQGNERLNLAKDAARIGIWDFDLRTGALVWDARMHRMYDTEPAKFTGDVTAWQRRLHPDDLTRAEAELSHAIATGGKFETVFRIVVGEGEVRHIEAHATVLADQLGQARRVVGVNVDITERYAAEQTLSLAASVFDHAHDGILITDADQRIIDVNPAFTEVTGYARDEVLGQTPALLKSGKQDQAFYEAMWAQLHAEGFWRGEIWNRRKSGELIAQMETISAIKDAHGNVARYIAVSADITQLVSQQEELERMAHYDALTGLPNRVLLADRINQAMASARRSGRQLAVCYLDLDGFKPVNDRFGHAAGDALLTEVAGRFKRLLRGGDSVARLGGDEFVILLSDVDDLRGCEQALDRVVEGVSENYAVADDTHVQISASIGVTLYPMDDVDADTLLRHADQAMYQAKEGGRGRYHIFDTEQNRQLQAHRQTIARVGAALHNEEFVLHYQPKVDMRSGEIIGAEALLRWNHPERGMLPPFEFLPVVEQDNMAISVGEWVIGEVLRQQSQWIRDGISLKVSINISARHLQQPGFADDLERLMKTHGDVPPALIELEVLETTALNDISKVSEIIAQCRRLGVRVSLDDFGTGYSSLTYLKRLPADTLKIDRSFVRDMLSDPEDLAIVEGIVGLSKAFRRHVIAEGVETEHHGKLLLRLGCHLAQGYGIARPMPAAQLAQWIGDYKQPLAWRATGAMHWLRDDLPLYAAPFHYGQWVDQLVAGIDQDAPLDVGGDVVVALRQFSTWYDGEGADRYGHLAEFTAIGPLRRALHQQADESVRQQRVGAMRNSAEARTRLRALVQRFVERVDALQARLDGLHESAPSDAACEAQVSFA